MSDKTVLTGIKPTGTPHLGNYVGALKPLIEMAKTDKTFVFIADLHALNIIHDPKQIQQHTYEIAAILLALGLNLDNATLFRQSDIVQVSQLSTMLMNVTPKGLMNRAHSYKAALEKNEAAGADPDAGVNMGLYTYPILMAADILLYDTDVVPVGADQKQHVEFARDIAGYFNHLPDESTIFQLYKHFATATEIADLRARFERGGMGYGDAKKILFEKINSVLAAPRAEYERLMANTSELDRILADGAARARNVAEKTYERVHHAMLG